LGTGTNRHPFIDPWRTEADTVRLTLCVFMSHRPCARIQASIRTRARARTHTHTRKTHICIRTSMCTQKQQIGPKNCESQPRRNCYRFPKAYGPGSAGQGSTLKASNVERIAAATPVRPGGAMSVASGVGGVSLFLHSKAAAYAVVGVVVLISQYLEHAMQKEHTHAHNGVRHCARNRCGCSCIAQQPHLPLPSFCVEEKEQEKVRECNL
jgi:hypothetical protein